MALNSQPFQTLVAQALSGNVKWRVARTTSADGTTTAGSANVSSASANFTQADVGATVTGSTLTGGPYTISSVTDYQHVVLNSGTGVTAGSTAALTITPTTDTVKMALFSAAPSLASPLYQDLSSEITGTGYSAGGVALSSLTAVTTAANSWGTAWSASAAHSVGDVVRPSASPNGFLYQCVVAGTSSGTEPTWGTVVGGVTTDNTVTWALVGESIAVYSSAAAQWTSATFSASYAVVYDSTSGANIALITFATTQSPSAGTLTVTPPSTGWLSAFPN